MEALRLLDWLQQKIKNYNILPSSLYVLLFLECQSRLMKGINVSCKLLF